MKKQVSYFEIERVQFWKLLLGLSLIAIGSISILGFMQLGETAIGSGYNGWVEFFLTMSIISQGLIVFSGIFLLMNSVETEEIEIKTKTKNDNINSSK